MNIDRYARHKTLVELGKEGQNFLAKGSAAVVGCGGLGATASMLLARCGVGSLIIIDRDIVELHNLQRQILYLEEDVGKPKAKVAKERLEQMNSEIRIQAHQESLDHSNLYMLEGADVIVDATDNLTTRFLLNDYAVKNKIPWVYGGAVGTEGMTATFMPESACFRCMFPNMPPPGTLATCESAGVLGTLPNMIASLQATEAIKLLAGAFPRSTILYVDPWHGVFKEAPIEKNKNCP
ncbi:MAG: HesA/MoeB/ThiF family protein, partial [Candidatus Thermoplasmatota archaeon]|nr:HesA/MoeB/ThiF family protein [Candidatus Thermoplasmatota archaeon]